MSASFPVVGVGASAGGVEALEGLFRGMPPEPGVALVVVTHLDPTRGSRLPEIIGRYTSLAVCKATDGMQLEPNHVYVLTSDAIVSLEGTRLSLRSQSVTPRERKPIDIFFSTLAAALGDLAAGVVLSGGDTDGTLGVKAIKEHGGLTLAQTRDGFGPQHPDMPETAISSGFVDLAIPADEMGSKLAEFAQNANMLDELDERSARNQERQALETARLEISAILRNGIGHDFAGYKPNTFLRRVQRRMQVRQLQVPEAYVDLLRRDPQEVAALFRDLLINVTNFFRDGDAFDSLAAKVVPRLFEGKGADATIRVWIPGCATGEEVYSLAILLREHMHTLTAGPAVQLFATDIDERSLEIARAGRYPAPMLTSVSPERLQRFFVPHGESYVVAKEVRDICIFSPHSVIRDPPFSRIDLISCRNLLIYFGADVQSFAIATFHYALRPGAFLFLGTSESITQSADLFSPIDKKHRIFQRRSDVATRLKVPLAVKGLAGPFSTIDLPPRRPPGAIALRQQVDSAVMDRYAPPHVVVNRDGDIVFFSMRTGKYLEAAPGSPTRQLLNMARKGLRLDLRTVLRAAVETGRSTTRTGVSVEGDDGRIQIVTLTAEPVTETTDGDPLFLVLFIDEGGTIGREQVHRTNVLEDDTARKVERELRDMLERLQSMVEEYETALEELKSSNEELVAVNEELQSTNEELEASKEELQSLNEELHTVNAELSEKVEALDSANSDLQNLFESTNIATVFLDRKLVIRSFTPPVMRLFGILPGDRGRPITDLSARFSPPDLAPRIAETMASGKTLEWRVAHNEERTSYLVRLAPYWGSDERMAGTVVTFVDISMLAQVEERKVALIAELQHRTRNLLSVVGSIAQQTIAQHTGGPQANGRGKVMDAFFARLSALGRVQGFLSQIPAADVDVGELVHLELDAFASQAADRVSVGGPRIGLHPEQVQTFALTLHELATNAFKFGALSSEQGRLDVSWALGGDGRTLVLDWREAGVRMPPAPAPRGYGRQLIEKALSHTLRARTELVFGEDGVHCRIILPLGRVADAAG